MSRRGGRERVGISGRGAKRRSGHDRDGSAACTQRWELMRDIRDIQYGLEILLLKNGSQDRQGSGT